MTNLSEIYDVLENIRGKALNGLVRPTVCQLLGHCDFIEVIKDITAPVVTITSHTDGYSLISDKITLYGTASDNFELVSVTWRTGDNSGSASGTSDWVAANIPLVEGQNIIEISATDASGNQTTEVIGVIKDTTYPTVTISSHADGAFVNSEEITLQGVSSDNQGVSEVAWSNGDSQGTATGTINWIASDIPLSDGSNNINITVSDTAGNQTISSITIIRDSVSPTITITSHNDDDLITTNSILLQGTSSDARGVVEVTWSNGANNGTAIGTTSWSVPNLPLNGGINNINVTAFDSAGNQKTSSVVITHIAAPTYTSKVTAYDGASDDNFGRSVAVGSDRVVVGSHYDDDGGKLQSGSVYIYNTSGGLVGKITAPDAAAGDTFGHAVDVSSNVIVASAPLNDDGGASSGSAYIFNTSGGYVTKITAPDATESDHFGISIAASDSHVVVGAHQDDDGGYDSGSAYLFNTSGVYISKLLSPDLASRDYFGYSVAVSDSAVVVGAYGDAVAGSYTGSAYIYNTSGNYITKITAPDAAAGHRFGHSVAVNSTRVVVGAYRSTVNSVETGAVYIFNTNGGYIAKIAAPDGAESDQFGYSVSVNSSTIIVGAPIDSDSGVGSGSVYIFDINGNYISKITALDGDTYDYFGWSVGIGTTTSVVGAMSDDDKGSASGSAYIYSL